MSYEKGQGNRKGAWLQYQRPACSLAEPGSILCGRQGQQGKGRVVRRCLAERVF